MNNWSFLRFGTGRLMIAILALLLSSTLQAAKAPYADTVIVNGKVITADADDPEAVSMAEAIAIRGDRILAVGSNAEIRELVADWTEVIDAKGNSVLPGLIDTHNHIYETSLGFPWVVKRIPEMLEIAVEGETVEELADIVHKAVRARAQRIPEGQWIMIDADPAGVAVKAFGNNITRDSLDAAAPNHPTYVSTRGGSVLGSQAIRTIEDYYGNQLPEAYWMVDRELGWSGEYTDFGRCIKVDIINTNGGTLDEYIQGYFEVLQANAQIGVTTHKSHLQCEVGFSATNHLDRNDMMPIRMAWGHRWMQPFNPRIRETYRRIGDWHGHGSDYMWSIGASVGGIDAGGVGWCTSMEARDDSIKSREQCPPAPEELDLPFITDTNTVSNRDRRVEHLQTLANLAAEGRITGITGWHVSGDGALELMFQVYRNAMSDEKIRSLRIESDHCHTVTPEQIQLAARLGHTFSCDFSNTPTRVIKGGYSDEYLAWNAPVASMLKAGVNAVISEYGIQRELRSSPFEDGVNWLTRRDDNGEVWGVPEEAVPDKMTLLLMMTRYGAYPIWKEDDIGSIEAGKLADIVILNGDYQATPVMELDSLTSVLTLIGGEVAYEDPSLRGNTLRFNTDTADWTLRKNTSTDLWRWEETPQIPPFLQGASGSNPALAGPD